MMQGNNNGRLRKKRIKKKGNWFTTISKSKVADGNLSLRKSTDG
jgi:hypothetical protein